MSNKYQEYENKIHNRAKVLRVIYSLRFLITGIIISLIAAFFTLTSLKGLIIENKVLEKVYTYGDTITPEASSFLNDDIDYEYSLLNEESWTRETPKKTGYYQMRAYSTNAYGLKMTSSIQEFQIVPINATIKVNIDTISYSDSDKPIVTYSIDGSDNIDTLLFNDRITSYDVIYDDLSKETTNVKVDLDSITIVDNNGEDVTDCYSFNNPETSITITPINLTIDLSKNSKQKTYDGSVLSLDNTISDVTGLKDGDSIVSLPTSDNSIIDVGTTEIKPKEGYKLQIVNSDGIDVTSHYTPIYKYGSLEVTKRDLQIEIYDASYEYDGEEHLYPKPTISTNTPLADSDILTITNFTDTKTEIYTGNYLQEYSIEIKNKQTGNSTIDNYSIEYIRYDNNGKRYTNTKTSILTITKRPLSIKASEATFYYSDQLNDIKIDQFTTVGLIEKDKLTITCDIDEDSIKEGSDSSTRVYTIDIVNQEGDSVKNNYSITKFSSLELDTSSLTFTKRKNTIIFNDQSIVYDGQVHSPSNVINENYVATEDLYGTDYIKTTTDDISSIDVSSKKYGSARIYRGDKDVTNLYDLSIIEGNFEIKKRPITISIYGDRDENNKTITSKIYDKESFNYFFEEVKSEDVDEGLISTHTISMECSDKVKKSNVTSFTATEDDFTITIKDSSGNVVTSNYEVRKVLDWNNDFNIEKKNVTITFKNIEKWYDGEAFSLKQLNDEDLNYYQVDGLLSGDYISIEGVNTYKDEGVYQLNNVIPIEKIKVKDISNNDVSDNYAITTNLSEVNLIIKKIKIVYSVSGNDTIYNGQTIHYSTDNETETDVEKTLNFSSETTMPNSDDKFYDVSSLIITATGKDVATLEYKKNDLTFKAKKTYLKDITIDKVDFSNSKETNVNITKRNIKIDIKDYTYYWHHSSDFNADYIGEKLLTSENLVSTHKIIFTWAEKTNGVHSVGSYSFKDDFKMDIVDESNKSVLDNYDIDSSSNYGTLTIKKMVIDLEWKIERVDDSIIYDNQDHYYSESNSSIYSIASSSVCPDLDSLTLTSYCTENERDICFDSNGNVISYMLSLISSSIKWSDNALCTYSWEKDGLNNDFEINNVENVKPELTINKRKAAYSITFNDGSTSKDVMYTNRSIELNNKSINTNKETTQYINYLITDIGVNVEGILYNLPDGCKFVLNRNNNSLPNNIGIYNMMDYYDVHIVDTKRNDLDITDNFDLIEKPTLTLNIKKINITVKAYDVTFTYGTIPEIQYEASGNASNKNLEYEQPSAKIFDGLEIGENDDIDLSPSKVTYISDDGYKYELTKEDEWTFDKTKITQNPITPPTPQTTKIPEVRLLAVPNTTYKFSDYFTTELLGDTSYLAEGDKLVVTPKISLDFSYTSEQKDVKYSDLDFKVYHGNEDVSNKYDLSMYDSDSVAFEVSLNKSDTLTASISDNKYSQTYSGKQVAESKLVNYFINYFSVKGEDNLDISDITIVLNNEDLVLSNNNYKYGFVGTYDRTIKSFTCKIKMQPNVSYYLNGDNTLFSSKNVGTKKEFIFDSAIENQYFRIATNGFENNLVVEITKATLCLYPPSDMNTNITIYKKKKQYTYKDEYNRLVSSVEAPSCYFIGEELDSDDFKIQLNIKSFSETTTTSTDYWDYIDLENIKITDKYGNDVTFCFEIQNEGKMSINFTLVESVIGKW